MEIYKLELFWNDIPTEREKAITYYALMAKWSCNERHVRSILHELSTFDNGDNYILVRSGANKGFYKTDDVKTIETYKNECMNKGRSVLAPIKKINRVLRSDSMQYGFENNLRLIREEKGFKQSDVVRSIRNYDKAVDKAMLSKMENGVCLPTPYQVSILAEIYGCDASELIDVNFVY